MRSLRNIQFRQFETASSTKVPNTRMQSVYTLLLLLGVGLVLYWWSGGFPPTVWRATAQIIMQLRPLWLLKGSSIVMSLVLLALQAIALAIAWGIFFWVAFQECMHVLAESTKKPLARSGVLAASRNKKQAKTDTSFSRDQLAARRDRLKQQNAQAQTAQVPQQEPLPGPDDITLPSIIIPRQDQVTQAPKPVSVEEDEPLVMMPMSPEQLALMKNPFEEHDQSPDPFAVQKGAADLTPASQNSANEPATNPDISDDPFKFVAPDLAFQDEEIDLTPKKAPRGPAPKHVRDTVTTPDENNHQVQAQGTVRDAG